MLGARTFRHLLSALAFCCGAVAPSLPAATAPAQLSIQLGILVRDRPVPPIFPFDAPPADEGLAGARLAIADNNTTGAFIGQVFTLEETILAAKASAAEAALRLADHGARFILADLAADDILSVTDALKGRDVVVFNVAATDDRLRGVDCRADVVHTAPSRAMLADALVQYLARMRWPKLFLVVGPQPADALYAEALRRSVAKFGLAIAAEKPWEFGPLARARADSITQSEAFVFTRGVDYDVLAVADEAGDFGDAVAYRTAEPKLVVGTQGLVATSWHRTHDAYGAAQLQTRFFKAAGRAMRPIDYQAWLAVRAVGEAATRTKSANAAEVLAFMLSNSFQLAAFKGAPLSLRPWDHQLRQPILIAQPAAIVSMSPQDGFLHRRTVLDSLGVDEPETQCHLK